MTPDEIACAAYFTVYIVAVITGIVIMKISDDKVNDDALATTLIAPFFWPFIVGIFAIGIPLEWIGKKCINWLNK